LALDIHVERHFCEPFSDAASKHLTAVKILTCKIVATVSQLIPKLSISKLTGFRGAATDGFTHGASGSDFRGIKAGRRRGPIFWHNSTGSPDSHEKRFPLPHRRDARNGINRG
jgi:hypothetical protein